MNRFEVKPRLKLESEEEFLPLIEAVNLGVKYNSVRRRQDFKSLVHKLMLGGFQQRKNEFWALKEISFSAYPGEVIGIIGANGAGKTTLCRALAGLLRPDMGSVTIRGEVSSLLSLGTGFDNELSGRDNVFLNGMMLGFSRQYIDELLPSILEFSGLGQFMEQPIKYYSKGMVARLGFSIAATLEAEILIIDEVLSTGDLEFQEKAAAKMQRLVEKANLVIIVSHRLDFIEDNCTQALWIEDGELLASGKPKEMITLYKERVKEKSGKENIINFKESRLEAGEFESIKVKNMGLHYKIDRKPFWALKDVNFSLNEKEIVGVIGHNGAGKSTLCQALCGILKADEGTIWVDGNISALLSFGTGFNPQLSGRDNIHLNGLMLGFSKKVMRRLESEIINFSELEDHIDKPVKNYSDGMRARLGFSIAAMLRPDIFIVDEVLSAGDMAFQEKATLRMQEMLGDAKTVLIVTHNMNIVEKVCTRVLWFNKGELKFDGAPKEAVEKYIDSVRNKETVK